MCNNFTRLECVADFETLKFLARRTIVRKLALVVFSFSMCLFLNQHASYHGVAREFKKFNLVEIISLTEKHAETN